jgi:hypothetical protein
MQVVAITAQGIKVQIVPFIYAFADTFYELEHLVSNQIFPILQHKDHVVAYSICAMRGMPDIHVALIERKKFDTAASSGVWTQLGINQHPHPYCLENRIHQSHQRVKIRSLLHAYHLACVPDGK